MNEADTKPRNPLHYRNDRNQQIFSCTNVSSINSNSILRYDGQTGAFIDAFITSANGGTISGPREFVFWNTNPTTLNYQPGRSGSDGGRAIFAGLHFSQATDSGALVNAANPAALATAPSVAPISSDTALGSASTAGTVSNVVGTHSDGLESVTPWLGGPSDLDLLAWTLT